ncbi:MAG: 16S rRNA processing protein RimM [Gemmatimonadetes bacterium]|nr:16S rRNA processing protein RimM [Gemmatimonadota bacterium]MCC7132535.1 16S rRNA processing protein RimM [Gemmatimonadales bacterium]
MTTEPARHLVVGRLRKPHGLKGECTVFPLTSDPEAVFAKGRAVWLMKLNGELVQGPLIVDRSRAYHREWLVAFKGYPERSAVEGWNDLLLSAPADTLRPPDDGEVYLHELTGFSVVDETGQALGIVTAVDEVVTGVLLEVQGKKREFVLPFRKEFVVGVDRERRRLDVKLPEGMVE